LSSGLNDHNLVTTIFFLNECSFYVLSDTIPSLLDLLGDLCELSAEDREFVEISAECFLTVVNDSRILRNKSVAVVSEARDTDLSLVNLTLTVSFELVGQSRLICTCKCFTKTYR